MSNNKQQTEINAVEYLDKVNQFAKENNTDKPKQQTAIEWLFEKMMTERHPISVWNDIVEEAKEMEKEQIVEADLNATKRTAKGVNADVSIRRVKELAEQYYNETYGGNK